MRYAWRALKDPLGSTLGFEVFTVRPSGELVKAFEVTPPEGGGDATEKSLEDLCKPAQVLHQGSPLGPVYQGGVLSGQYRAFDQGQVFAR